MSSSYTAPLLAWYSRNARDLPWRRATGPAAAWSVLVSEIMLQQTPVARVLPVHGLWLERWPTPAALASAAPGDAIREWGRLGYPRRALRLHAAAGAIVERHGGQVPSSVASLLELPGVGTYTAAAVAAFAFCQREAVLDTNVRRVLARLVGGTAGPVSASGAPAGSGLSVAEVRLATSLLPSDPAVAARWSVAVMELGALVCTAATSPACEACPLAGQCAWLAAGRPAGAGKRPAQRYEGTDRQCRGRVLAVLRSSLAPVGRADFDVVWTSPVQLERALDGLVSDGLVDPLPDGRFALPGTAG
ncbi:MAG TPA: A/G-specific adenine glycosylase [Streptosporangiaceae bacterium]|nr:A/G-specific adenine glycosylase [Streptosporangiaceae bacterium]